MRNYVFLYLLSLLLLGVPAGMTAQSQVSVGTPAGIFAVSPMGGATYSIPIEVPSGIGGMEPKVSIDYNSQSGNGLCGFGCNIGGISVITRGVRDIYHDGAAGGLAYADSTFYLDGQRLIWQCDIAGSDSVVYCPEADPYTKVVYLKSATSLFDTPFIVYTPDGLKYEYGGISATQIAIHPGSKSCAWYVSRAEDNLGGTIVYNYTTSGISSYPIPETIQYGNNLSDAVTFTYESRPDTLAFPLKYDRGTMAVRLKTITSSTSGTTYRQYTLSYDDQGDSTAKKYSRLTSVTESNTSGEAMNPIVLQWDHLPAFSTQAGTLDANLTSYKLQHQYTDFSLMSYDYNNDGLSDIIQHAYGSIYENGSRQHYNFYYLHRSFFDTEGTLHSYSPIYFMLPPDNEAKGKWSYHSNAPLIGDMDGDGISDMVCPYLNSKSGSSSIHFFYVLGNDILTSGNTYYNNLINYTLLHSSEMPASVLADFDNDGCADLLVLEKGGSGGNYDFSVFRGGHGFPHPSIESFSSTLSLSGAPKKLFASDYNGDGLTDILVVMAYGDKIFWNTGNGLSAATFTDSSSQTGADLSDRAVMREGDFNGDGITDYLTNARNDSRWYVHRGRGDGTFSSSVACTLDVYEQTTANDDNRLSCLVYDINGDGLSDVVISKAMYSGSSFSKTKTRWLVSDGTTLTPLSSATSNREGNAYSRYYTVGDFNGDGLAELVHFGYNCYDAVNANVTSQLRCFSNSSWHAGAGKVGTFTDGLGSSTAVTYRPLTDSDVYSRSFNAASTFPLLTLTAPLPVVYEASAGNGSAGTVTTRYSYGDLQYHCQGRGLLGFNTTSADNLTTGVYTVSTVTRNSQTLLPQQTETRQIIGNVWSTDVSSYLSHPHHNTRALYHTLLSTVSTDFDGNTTTTAFVSDSTRNNVPLSVTVEGWDGARVTTAYSGYVQCGRRYLPQTITETRRHPDHGSDFTQVTTRQYNAQGLTATEVLNAGTAKALTTNYAYDSRGNVTQTVTTGQDIETVTVLYDYDDSHRFVTRKTERGYMVTDYTRDLWGNVLSETDRTRSAYPETTAYTYDGWGRLTATEYPTGETATRTIGWDATPAMRYYVLEQCDGRPWVKTWYDNTGRMQRRQTIGQKNLSISETFSYDARGLMTGHTTQRGSQSITAAMTYDSRGRLLTDTDDFGRNLSYSYGTNSVTTTDNGRSFTRTFDSWGNVKSSSDPVSQVTYKYHACGKPKQATSAGAVVTMGYDAAGNRTSLTDPDAGTMTYSYDALGRIRTQTDGNGILTASTYNSRGQLSQSVSGTVTTTYTYGWGPSDNGLLTAMSRGQFSETFLYDACRRVTQDTRNFGGGITRTLTYEYDSIGRLAARGYPGGLTVSYDYDAGGFLERLRSGGSTVYELQSYGGNVSTEKLGSTMTRIRSFDRKDRPLTSLTVAAGSTLAYLTQSYTWNSGTGNLTSRTINGSTEQFTYDSLDRLTGASVSGGTGTYVMYDTNGNIDVKHGTAHPIGSYYYDSSRPHAVTDIENPLGAVDLPSDYVTVSYNELGKAATVTDDSNPYIAYHYGPDHERWRGVQHVGGSTWSNLYFGDYEERYVNANSRRSFVYLDGGVLAVSNNGGSYQFYYIHTDHQGSILAITDAQGSYVFKASYDAWGRQTVTMNTLNFNRGYTGHEMMREGGLINMNGRIYDSALGLFLSPDNYVQEPLNSQNFNRYSYCLNNPLKYVDPDGEILGFIGGFFRGLFKSVTKGDLLAPFKESWRGLKMDVKVFGGLFTGNIKQIVSRLTWESLQTVLGLLYSETRLLLYDIEAVEYYDGATYVINKNKNTRNGITIGSYININDKNDIPYDVDGNFAPYKDNLYMHEYGHYMQSQDYGFGYLFSVGIPSIWDLAFQGGNNSIGGYSKHSLKWFEIDANKRGKKHFKGKNYLWNEKDYPLKDPFK